MSKVFYDFEFTRKHQQTTPISLGMVSEDGQKQFYAEFSDYDVKQVDKWLENHVFKSMTLNTKPEGYLFYQDGLTEIKGSIEYVVTSSGGLMEWFDTIPGLITLASFGSSYDHVLFRELFLQTNQTNIFNKIADFPYDVATLFQEHGYDPHIEGEKERSVGINEYPNKHNALFDAQIARYIYIKLKKYIL